jgi:hypothetical protein
MEGHPCLFHGRRGHAGGADHAPSEPAGQHAGQFRVFRSGQVQLGQHPPGSRLQQLPGWASRTDRLYGLSAIEFSLLFALNAAGMIVLGVQRAGHRRRFRRMAPKPADGEYISTSPGAAIDDRAAQRADRSRRPQDGPYDDRHTRPVS